MLPSADNATEEPCAPLPTAPVPTSFDPCCFHVAPERANTQTAPAPLLSAGPPINAVLPSEERATAHPWFAGPAALEPSSFVPCCAHTPPVRVNTQTAPAPLLSAGPPTSAVLPSVESAVAQPWLAVPVGLVPTSLLLCCVHTPPERANTQAAPAPSLSR